MKKVEVISKKRLFDEFFKIDEATLRFEKFNGEFSPIVKRLVFERGDSVAAIVINKDSQLVIFVNQFKYPAYVKGQGWLTETVAGMVEEDENAGEAISREMIEEIGYAPTYLEHISTFFVSPGGTSERIILYYAETDEANKQNEGGGVATEHEDIQLVTYTLSELWAALDSGELADAKTIIGAMWLRRRLEVVK